MIDDLVRVSTALEPELVPMPADADDVCPVCRAHRRPGDELCFSCERTTSQVAHPCPLVIPISYYSKPSRLRDRMHDFKGHSDEDVRADEAAAIAAIATRYMYEHGAALQDAFGPVDATVAVPSTHHDNKSPLQHAIENHYPGILPDFQQPLRRGPGEMDFLSAAEDGFTISTPADVAGRRILLLDDTFTTGARVNSASHALTAAGARVAVAVVVTRKINPSQKYGNLDLWERQRAKRFTFDAHPWWRL